MPERVTTSFIPKTSLKVERAETIQRTTLGIFNVLALILLIIAIIAAIGVFLFEQYTKSSIESKQASLDRARAAFQVATIKELTRLDTRLTVGGRLLGAHIAPSVIFDYLEREALSSIRFRDFTYSEAGQGKMVVSMSGQARSFNAVALQSAEFGESDLFTDVIFSNLNIDPSGNVVFDFSATIDAGLILYANRSGRPVNNEEPAVEAVPETEAPTL